MPRTTRKIPVLDLNQSAFHMLHGDNPQEEMQPGGRVAFMHEAGETFYELSGRYNANEAVPVQDYVNCQRQLRARMMSLKNGNEKGTDHGRRTF
jgi:hypothetical protein